MKHISVIKDWRKPIDPYLKLKINLALCHCWIASDDQIEIEVSSVMLFPPVSLGFAFLKNMCSTFSLCYSVPGKKSVGKSMEAVREGGDMLYIFSESESTKLKPHASYLLSGFQKKQRLNGCSSLKVVGFHMAQSTIYSKYSRILRLVLTMSFLYIITCVLQMLNNDHFSCHSDLI